MPSSPGTRKRQQGARRAALSESAKKRARRENTKALKKARKELDAAERLSEELCLHARKAAHTK